MSGDVQPRKRKEKRKRKDELGFDEHRGTSAALGEGDVFIHSQHEHGTGGHWCAKIIFFSLLAVLITLVGLIILENRGLSELEANTVESRYSGVLEGWLEDAPDDDHHDKHTLELKQNSIKSEDVKKHEDDQKVNDSDQSEETEPEESDIDKEDNLSKEDDHDLESDENEDAVRLNKYSSNINYNDDNHDGYDDNNNSENDDDDDDEENDQYEDDDDEDDTNFRVKKDNYNLEQGEYSNNDDELGNNVQNFEEQNDDDDDHGGDDDDDGDEDDDNDDRDDYENDAEDDKSIDDSRNDDVKEDENDDIDVYYSYGEQVINRKNIDDSNEKDDDDDDDDDENDNILTKFNQYLVEKSAEQNENDGHEHENDFETQDTNIERIEREVLDDILISAELPTAGVDDVNDSQQASQEIQNKEDDDENDDEFFEEIGDDELPVVEHITAPAGKPFDEVEESSTEQSPGPDSLADEEEYEKRQEELRREEAEASHMWLKLFVGGALLVATHALIRRASGAHEVPTHHTTREETPGRDRRMTLIPEESPSVNPENVFEHKFSETTEEIIRNLPTVTKLSHSEDDEQNENNTEEEQLIKLKTTQEDKELYSDNEDDDENEQENLDEEIEDNDVREADDADVEAVVEEEIADDVEIIEDEQIEEEEEISDVDDTELLNRLEAKYGRLPEPERFGPKPKDGGNSIEDEWPGEPTDAYWRDELNKAEEELRQGWLD